MYIQKNKTFRDGARSEDTLWLYEKPYENESKSLEVESSECEIHFSQSTKAKLEIEILFLFKVVKAK